MHRHHHADRDVHADHDVGAFDTRAATYEDGWNGRMHVDIARRTAKVAQAARPDAARVLDVGCGTGLVLRQLAARLPEAETVVGIDPAPGMIEVARQKASEPAPDGDHRLRFDSGTAEELPYADGSFDLVVSAVSFHHWKDQGAGLKECARVLAPGGRLVLADLLTLWLLPTSVRFRGDRARTRRQVGSLLGEAGFSSVRWHPIYARIISAAVAVR